MQRPRGATPSPPGRETSQTQSQAEETEEERRGGGGRRCEEESPGEETKDRKKCQEYSYVIFNTPM